MFEIILVFYKNDGSLIVCPGFCELFVDIFPLVEWLCGQVKRLKQLRLSIQCVATPYSYQEVSSLDKHLYNRVISYQLTMFEIYVEQVSIPN